MKPRLDCIYFVGDKPCRYKRACYPCREYKRVNKRILIIKFAFTGDVLRTTPILSGLKKKYPSSHITWITRPESMAVLENNHLIDCLLVNGPGVLPRLLVQRFDLVISLDKEAESTALAEIARADEKTGFGLSAEGKVYPLNKNSEYAFRLGLDDDLKFRKNKKSYQEIIFDIAGLKYNKEEYTLILSDAQLRRSKELAGSFCINRQDKVVGFNTGCGDAFQGKKWTEEGFLKLGGRVSLIPNAKILLLGGPKEIERNASIARSAKFPLIDTGCGNTMRDFISIVNLCDLVICGDTVTLHIAIALKKKVIALFGPTVPQEIDLYGRGEKLFAGADCAPCYKRICARDDLCMKAIKADEVFRVVKRLLR